MLLDSELTTLDALEDDTCRFLLGKKALEHNEFTIHASGRIVYSLAMDG